MKKTRLIVNGAAGRMGKRVVRLAASGEEGVTLAAALERPGHPDLGKDAGEVAGCPPTGVALSDDLAAAYGRGDVIVDFTAPTPCLAALKEAARAGKPIVIGTTGFSDQERTDLERLAGTIPSVVAPNMSVGMNLLFLEVEKFARALEGYDVEIVETHHRHKKDAPSGTALGLARAAARGLGRDLDKAAVYGRKGITGPRSPGQIGIHAVRAGEIIGEHTVLFAGPGERVEITHRAESRDAFARGAVLAARFVAGADPGLHDMAEVLGLK